jgi:hypothetical protein
MKKLLLATGVMAFLTGLTPLANALSVYTYSTPGNYTWTCPPGVNSVTIQCWGGGGGGGGVGVNYGEAGGGAGGAYTTYSVSVTPGTPYNLTVGAGGTGGTGGAAGTGGTGATGGSSYFGNSATGNPGGATVVAVGGFGGGADNTAGGTSSIYTTSSGGNTNTTGDVPSPGTGGTPGGTPVASTVASGAGGNGAGASGSAGGGDGAASVTSAGNGTAGTTPGGGGSGGLQKSNASNGTGGNGGSGQVAITVSSGNPFSNGNLAVLEPGDASSNNTTITILSIQTNSFNQAYALTIPIDGTDASSLRMSGSAGSFGYMADSADGSLLAFTGANTNIATIAVNSITNRGVGTLDAAGNYVLQATYDYTNAGTVNSQPRCASTLDNSHWVFSDQAGIFTNGEVNPYPPGTFFTSAKAFGNTVYIGGTNPVVMTYSGGTTNPPPGLPSDANASDFYLISSGHNGNTYDVLYYIDNTSASAGAIYKYYLNSGTWTAEGSYLTKGGWALCAATNGDGTVNLYYVSGKGGTLGNSVIQVTDTSAYNASLSPANSNTLYTAGVGLTLKGIAFAPLSAGGSLATPPGLTAAPSATVDSSFNVTFSPDVPAWRLNITNITVGGTTLPTSSYMTNTAGQITFIPSASTLLQSAGSLSIVINAKGYTSDTAIQYLAPGAPTKLGLATQPGAPSGNGGTLVVQPTVTIEDQYGNPENTGSATVTAAVSTGQSGEWTLGGGLVIATAPNGQASYTNLSATVDGSSAVPSATITFSAPGLTAVTSSAFAILAPPTPFTSGNLAVLQADNTSANSTMTILELSPSGLNSSPVNSIAISATGPNALRNSGSAATTGRLSDTDDGTLLAFVAAEDGSSLTSDETAVINRGVGSVDSNGNVTLQCSYMGISGDQARGATSLDDSTWLISDKAGIYENGLSTPQNPTNVRSIRSFGGTAYVLSQNTTAISSVSPDGTTLTPLGNGPGASLPIDANCVDFYMLSSGINGSAFDTIYYLDDTNKTSGAIYKYYSPDGVSWYPQGSWPTANGGDGFCAALDGSGGAFLYYTTGSGGTAGNSLIRLDDSAAANAPINVTATSTIYTAGAKATLKGLAFAPIAASGPVTVITPLTIKPGSTTVTGSGASASASFSFTNAPGLSFSVLGTNLVSAPVATWPLVGTATESPAGSGHYQFTDPNPATNSTRFYILRQP